MDDELRTLIEETHEIAKDNQKRIKKIHRIQRRGILGRILYKVIIIGIAIGAFYFMRPYYNRLVEGYNQTVERIDTIQGYAKDPKTLFPEDTFNLGSLDEIDILRGLIPGE
jgi:uncharacterized membrane protein YukC